MEDGEAEGEALYRRRNVGLDSAGLEEFKTAELGISGIFSFFQ